VVQEPVEQADGGAVVGQEATPFLERPVAGDREAAAFVGGGDEPEQQLAAGAVQRREPDFVTDDEVVAEQGLDDLPDAVVGQAAVEVLDELGGGEVPDPQAAFDGGVPEGDQRVALAGAGRADQGQVLPGRDPLQRGQVGARSASRCCSRTGRTARPS
jgi:hypothetical protein